MHYLWLPMKKHSWWTCTSCMCINSTHVYRMFTVGNSFIVAIESLIEKCLSSAPTTYTQLQCYVFLLRVLGIDRGIIGNRQGPTEYCKQFYSCSSIYVLQLIPVIFVSLYITRNSQSRRPLIYLCFYCDVCRVNFDKLTDRRYPRIFSFSA